MRCCAPGDWRVGMVWHTQGAGKSLTMAFCARRVIPQRFMHQTEFAGLQIAQAAMDQFAAGG